MKALLSLLLTVLLLLEGCFSFYTVDEKEKLHLSDFDHQPIEIVLTDGTTIESDAGQHFEVTEPSHFILGKGTSLRRYTGTQKAFEGIIQ